jgi:toxin ParE1/3/4
MKSARGASHKVGRRKRRIVEISDEARDDLIQLYDWIADEGNPHVALSYIERFETYIQGFEMASERGYLRDDIRLGLRITGFEPRVAIACQGRTGNHPAGILRWAELDIKFAMG